MKSSLKVGLVLAGYVAAIVTASVAVAVRIYFTSGPEAQASSGMYAFGDVSLFLAVFVVVSLAPTGAALFFLRSHRLLWIVLSVLAVVVAITGLVTFIVFVVWRTAEEDSLFATWATLAPLRILAAPLLALAFLMSGFISPYRFPRIALVAAAVVEAAVSACAAVFWLNPFGFY